MRLRNRMILNVLFLIRAYYILTPIDYKTAISNEVAACL